MASDPEAVARSIYARRRPVSDADARRYLLSADEGRRIFRERIVPDLLDGRKPLARPTVVFLMGQQGAGKSRVASMVADVLSKRGGFADLDSDLYKPYHPQHDELMSRDDRLMAAYIGPDSWAWLAQAHEYARTEKINVLKPETGQDSRGAVTYMRAYRDAGYRVEIMATAVPAAMSNQGIISRYHQQVVDRGHGRLTVQANADRAYTGLLDLADVIDRERLADEVGVFRRGEATPQYSNSLTSAGQWRAAPGLRAAIDGERVRPWTAEETADFLRTHARLRRELGDRWTQRLDEIMSQARPLLDRSMGAEEPPTSGQDPEPAAEPGIGGEVRRALTAARTADGGAAARRDDQERQADAGADEIARRQAAYWPTESDRQREARRQPEHSEPAAEADTEFEAGS